MTHSGSPVSARDRFGFYARLLSGLVAHPLATGLAFGLVIAWAVIGWRHGFSADWLLALNTTTTVVTFLMVFVLNHTQSRDTAAMNAKLDALIVAVAEADNRMVGLERLPETEAKAVHEEVTEAASEQSRA